MCEFCCFGFSLLFLTDDMLSRILWFCRILVHGKVFQFLAYLYLLLPYFQIEIMVNGIHVVYCVGEENRKEESDSNINQGVDEKKEEERIMEKCIPWFPSQPQKNRLKRVMVDRLSDMTRYSFTYFLF